MVERIASLSWPQVVERVIAAAGLVVTALYEVRIERLLPHWLGVALLVGTIWVFALVLVAAGTKLVRREATSDPAS